MSRPGFSPLIKNWESGGNWRVSYQPPELEDLPAVVFEGASPYVVVQKIISHRKANNLPPDTQKIWRLCNIIWGKKRPKAYTGNPQDLLVPLGMERATEIAGSGRRLLQPLDYGPWVWTFLNTFGVHFRKDLFLAAIEQARQLVRPRGENLGSGCAICYEHFQDTLLRYPAENVSTREEARVWVWIAHDRASKQAGNRRMPFEEVARRYGWPQMDKQNFTEIEERLKS